MGEVTEVTVRELIETAVAIEESGKRFYEKMAQKVANERLKEFFKMMAEEEEKHMNRFIAIGEKYGGDIYIESDEALLYLKRYTEGKVFPKVEELLEWVESKPFSEIVEYSITLEKESIIFYVELKAWLKDEKTRKVIDAIIDEEREHIKTLASMKEEN